MEHNNRVVKKCRTCLSENGVMFALFENYENDISLANIIQCFLNVKLNMYEDLPQEVCQDCATLLIQFYNFSITFEENNKKLVALHNDIQHCLILKDFDKRELKSIEVENNTKSDASDHIEDTTNLHETTMYNGNTEVTITIENDKGSERILIQTSDNPNIERSSDECKCNICNKDFKNLLLLRRHLQLHVLNKKFICEICGYVSLKKAYLMDHMETHTVDKPYKCSYCDKAFRRRSIFSRHKKIHTNPMEIVCEMCGQLFTDRNTLKTHIILIHTKSRNFKCFLCNQSFSLKATLNKHLKRHQQKEDTTKRFTCEKCNMQYFDKCSLKRHFHSKHSGVDVRFKCQTCCKEYMTKANLLKHRTSAHHTKIEGY